MNQASRRPSSIWPDLRRTWQTLLAVLAFVVLTTTAFAQRASSWRVYRMLDGLPEPGCASVTVGPQGKVLARHLSLGAVSELDGYTIKTFRAPGPGQTRIYESPGGQLWNLGAEGIQEFSRGAWVVHPEPAVTAALRALPSLRSDAVQLWPVRQGRVLLLLPMQLCAFLAENPEGRRIEEIRSANDTQLGTFLGMTAARDGGFWVSGAKGIVRIQGPLRNLTSASTWTEFMPPEGLPVRDFRHPHDEEDGSLTLMADCTTNSQKMLVRFDGRTWQANSVNIPQVRRAWYGIDQSSWATTSESLFTWDEVRKQPREVEDISTRQYFDVAVESSDVFWLATANGLFHYTPLIWRTPPSVRSITAPVSALTTDSGGRLWFVAGTTLHLSESNHVVNFPFGQLTGRAADNRLHLYPVRDGTMLLGREDNWLLFDPHAGSFKPFPALTNSPNRRVIGPLSEGRVCLRTIQAETAGLEAFDGRESTPLGLPGPDVMPGANLQSAFEARNGDLWLSGESGTAFLHGGKWRFLSGEESGSPAGKVTFSEFPDGTICCATDDKIWTFDGKSWRILRSGFDHINSLLCSKDGRLWVATDAGLHRYGQGIWLENGIEEGLPGGDIRALAEDQHGRLWTGGTRGLSLFHPEADTEPPRTWLEGVDERPKQLKEGEEFSITFNAIDKWKHTPRERLLYSYRVDERDWSAFSEINHVAFADLPAGKHFFQVRAMDRNANVEPKPAHLDFAIVLPWYRETRLFLIATAGVGVALFFAGLAFNRHRRLVRSYAEVEKKVAERTSELELAGRELLHSQKMKALGTLSAGIAHDFNNILSIIKGSAQIIEENLDQPDKIRTRLDRIKTVVEQGSGVVKAMLGFSREELQSQGPCQVNEVVDDTLKLLGDRFMREVEVRFEPGQELPAVSVPRDFIQQIILNFLFNAAEAMSRNRQVRVATSQVEVLPAQMALAPPAGSLFVAVSVSDIGCGIAPENLPRIFEPFFTTKALSARRGTGLGLSMVYELAKKAGAGLTVESVMDQGSTFTLILPVWQPPKVETTRKQGA